MSKWKMVPVELTPEMLEADIDSACAFHKATCLGERITRLDGIRAGYAATIAAAPAWEPSDEDVERAFDAEAEAFAQCVADGTVMQQGQHYARRISLRAALKAAIGGHDEH